MYCNTLTVLQLKGLGKAGLYCDTMPNQATIRPGAAQAVGAGAHWARSRQALGRTGGRAGRAAGTQAASREGRRRRRVAGAGVQAGAQSSGRACVLGELA